MTGKLKLLLVDDDPQFVSMLSETLQRLGAATACADSGEKVPAMADEARFDGVFLDCRMPGQGPLIAAQAIRQSTLNSRCPIVVMTGSEDLAPLASILRDGHYFFVQKPIDRQHVTRILAELVSLKHSSLNMQA